MKTIKTFISLAATLTISFTAFTAIQGNPLMGQTKVDPALTLNIPPLSLAEGHRMNKLPEQPSLIKPVVTVIHEANNAKPDCSYLRFDATSFYDENETEISELPEPEFNYLKFDVSYFEDQNPVNPKDMPVNEFEYLRFDVNQFINADNHSIDEDEELSSAE